MGCESEWRVIGQSVRGASHLRSGLPNQDALHWLPASQVGPPLILVVSDGHGSAKSFRSHIGSRLAVERTAWLIQDLLDGQPDPTNLSSVKRTAEERLPREIARTWRQAVDEHLLTTPLGPDELEALAEREGERARKQVETNPYLAYGATVLAVLVTPVFVLYLQLGDGDILVVSEDGVVMRPIAGDARLFANETTSLCMTDAWREIRFRFQAHSGNPPALIMVSTDGYANSFVNEAAFLKVGEDVLEMVLAEGPEYVAQHLEEWLVQATRSGSGDDITLGIAYRADVAPSQARRAEPVPVEAELPAGDASGVTTEVASPNEGGPGVSPSTGTRSSSRTAQVKQEVPREPTKRLPELFVDE